LKTESQRIQRTLVTQAPAVAPESRERLKTESQKVRLSTESALSTPAYQKPTSGAQTKKLQCSYCECDLEWDCLQQNTARIQDGKFICKLCDFKALTARLKTKRFRWISALAGVVALIVLLLRPADFIFVLMGLTVLAFPLVYLSTNFKFSIRLGLATGCLVLFWGEAYLLNTMQRNVVTTGPTVDDKIQVEAKDIQELLGLNEYRAAHQRLKMLRNLAFQDADKATRDRRKEVVAQIDKIFTAWRSQKFGANTATEHKFIETILDQNQDCKFTTIHLNDKVLTLEYTLGTEPDVLASNLFESTKGLGVTLQEIRVKCSDKTPNTLQTFKVGMTPPQQTQPPNGEAIPSPTIPPGIPPNSPSK
jgi:hypothetical protein